MPSRRPAYISGIPVWLLRSAVGIAMVVCVYLAFEFGRIQSGYNIADTLAEERDFREEIATLERRVTSLQQEIATLETHREIERAAYKEVEGNLVELQRKIQEQRDAIAFYRGIVAPEDGERGLRVQDFKLSRGSEERSYNVRLVLVQAIQNDRTVNGEVALTLEGEQEGSMISYSFDQLVPPEQDSSWPFSFRYFQDFNRQVILPDGFTPEKVNIEVRSRTKSVASVEQSFLWQVGRS